jgi:hypothetical protein
MTAAKSIQDAAGTGLISEPLLLERRCEYLSYKIDFVRLQSGSSCAASGCQLSNRFANSLIIGFDDEVRQW